MITRVPAGANAIETRVEGDIVVVTTHINGKPSSWIELNLQQLGDLIDLLEEARASIRRGEAR